MKLSVSIAANSNLLECTRESRHTTEHVKVSRPSPGWTELLCVPDALSSTNEYESLV